MIGKFREVFQQARDEHKIQLWAAAIQSSQPTAEGGCLASRDPATAGVFLGQTSWGKRKNQNDFHNA